MEVRKRVGIIGAGMAGLTLARSLEGHAETRIFEKRHGVGGRMATRWLDAVSFDHGAQYFTIRDERFHDALETARANGIVEPWSGEVASLTESGLIERKHSGALRYVASPSMNALPKSLSIGLEIEHNAKVEAITGEPGRWFVNVREHTEGPFDWVVTTAPAPQSASILPDCFAHHERLRAVKMNACFTLMLRLKTCARIPFAAAHLDDPVINWIARNNSKPGRPTSACLVVNSNAIWADININRELESIRREMLHALRHYVLVDPVEANASVIHRWRYANVQRPVGAPFLLDHAAQLAACGDWCIAGRVEAAFQSASALFDALAAMIGASQ